MNYYSDLLASAFATISGNDRPNVIALIPSADGLWDARQAPGEMNPEELMASWLPQGMNAKSLGGGEDFVSQAKEAVESSGARCVFAFPPLLGELRMSPEWRERFGRLSMAEALAESLIGAAGGNSQVEILAMLVPAHFVSSLRSSTWRNEFFPAHTAVVIEHAHMTCRGRWGFQFTMRSGS